MAKAKISEEQKKREGAALAKYIERAKLSEPSLTQESLASEINKTQGLIGQWVSGTTPIPDKRVIWLAKRLKFDPLEFRPSLVEYLSSSALSGRPRLVQVLDLIPEGEEDYFSDVLLLMLEGKKQNR